MFRFTAVCHNYYYIFAHTLHKLSHPIIVFLYIHYTNWATPLLYSCTYNTPTQPPNYCIPVHTLHWVTSFYIRDCNELRSQTRSHYATVRKPLRYWLQNIRHSSYIRRHIISAELHSITTNRRTSGSCDGQSRLTQRRTQARWQATVLALNVKCCRVRPDKILVMLRYHATARTPLITHYHSSHSAPSARYCSTADVTLQLASTTTNWQQSQELWVSHKHLPATWYVSHVKWIEGPDSAK